MADNRLTNIPTEVRTTAGAISYSADSLKRILIGQAHPGDLLSEYRVLTIQLRSLEPFMEHLAERLSDGLRYEDAIDEWIQDSP